ncbi:EamA family transporter [Chitiniphilus purpureus]|uniref:EamA family transporter n=1 Tax=Chitiniphilus purpureus TaxID=2981137 RepID=A0ABY6DME3_9NEIS|nr:EamA family transporter [Chitiniphilus sp. CD1]UXY15540.1 EamA family transporter [Chitiniphilus sp. CD1]
MKILLLLVYVFGMTVGQILFKQVSDSASSGQNIFFHLLRELKFYIAISLYGVLTFYWVWLLDRIPLSSAYPFVALSIALVALIGMIFWGEAVEGLKVLGILLILAGVICIGLSKGTL